MLHLADSLSELGKSFQIPLTKGYFPHLFSTLENLDYVGEIPDKEYFDLTFSCKNEKDFKEFNAWHQEWKDSGREWNYLEQRELYCKNDVLMLAEIWLKYHEQSVQQYSMYPHLTFSPWFSVTIASYVHKTQIRHLHVDYNLEEMTAEELRDYAQTTWCGLEPEEQYYTRLSLRGGMTAICKYIHEGKYSYVDINSSYPSVQMDAANVYPVGSPTIEIHDADYYPCRKCFVNPMDVCQHSYKEKVQMRERIKHDKLDIKIVQPTDLEEYCLNFFGIITVDITPPKDLYHPLIQVYDEKKKRVIGSLNPIIKETIPSVTLVDAIKIGYKVTKIYRADRYKFAESKWRNGLCGQTYISKLQNAGVVEPKDQERIRKAYKERFDITLPPFDTFTKNPVAKLIAKKKSNTAWGKHAESTDHAQVKIVSVQGEEGGNFYKSLKENNHKITNIFSTNSRTFFNFKENRANTNPDLHRGYLPVAVFVTAYGRLKLWRQLVQIDPRGTKLKDLRVLAMDTDSIFYCEPNSTSTYCIPEGDVLGDWEVEDIELKHGGLEKFYSIGPKSYSVVCSDGYYSMKLKGATLKHAHKHLMTPEIMKDLVLSKKDGSKVAILPQSSFDYKLNGGDYAMTVRRFQKVVQFNESDVKGTFDWDHYRVVPDGFEIKNF